LIIVMRADVEPQDVDSVKSKIQELGLEVYESKGINYHIIGLIGDTSHVDDESFKTMRGVEKVIHVRNLSKGQAESFIRKTR